MEYSLGIGAAASSAAASAAGPVALLAAADGARAHLLPGHPDGANCVAWQPGVARALASGGQDGAVRFWDAAAGQHTATAALGDAWVEHIAWATGSGGAPLLLAASGRELHAVRPDGSPVHAFKPAPRTLCALGAHPLGGAVAAAHFGGVTLWDTDDFLVQKEFPYANGIHALVWSPDGRWLVCAGQKSGTLNAYKIGRDGKLTDTKQAVEASAAAAVVFVP